MIGSDTYKFEENKAKQTWKPGNMIYPIPAVMVSVTDGKGQDDIITVALDRYHLYQSSDGLYFSKTGAFFLFT